MIYLKVQSNYKTILSYCLKCREKTDIKNRRFVKTKHGRIMVSSNCGNCGGKKSRFIKQQEASRILSSLGVGTPLGKIPSVGPILFYR